ncbi:MAG TPA: MBL fold metallo-hydrolase, partial [Bradyrhizobium sp.]|nr:MBL fold metallo-hydrolase [Bradyrhizobium sp.]
MNDLNRRDLLTAAAAIGAASALSPLTSQQASAAAPAAAAQAPGFYRYKVGTIECTSINDGARSFPLPDKWVTNVSKD